MRREKNYVFDHFWSKNKEGIIFFDHFDLNLTFLTTLKMLFDHSENEKKRYETSLISMI